MDTRRLAKFLFEVSILARTRRAGWWFLGCGEQSVAEHSLQTAYAGYVLAKMAGVVDTSRVVMMCLLHDLPEARTGDQNYVHKRYTTADEEKAADDMARGLPFGPELKKLIEEFREGRTKEALLARDADQIDMLLELKHRQDAGCAGASGWMPYIAERILTEEGKILAEAIMNTHSATWWFNRDDRWWVDGANRAGHRSEARRPESGTPQEEKGSSSEKSGK